MPFGNRSDGEKLVAAWDKIVGNGTDPKPANNINPYDAKIESEDDLVDTDDNNLVTAYSLLSSWGFEHPVGQMMAYHAERILPYTIGQLFTALESTRGSNNVQVAELKESIRGMIAMAYAWAYVIAKTRRLGVKDRNIYPELAELSSTSMGSEERGRLTKSGENKLEVTLGLLLQAYDSAKRQGKQNLQLFYSGSLQMLYACSNEAFGKSQDYTEAAK
jgi:hypothetical protein